MQRLNVFLAQHTGLSRRAADRAIEEGRVSINGRPVLLGQQVQEDDKVAFDGRTITPDTETKTIMLNKPIGYVCSREGQGSKTIYELLPKELHHLKPVGRLDKDSSGLLLLTNDGQLANQLTHPRYQKIKVYEVEIDKPLSEKDFAAIIRNGVDIGDKKLSRFQLEAKSKNQNEKSEGKLWQATLNEGRNRQIRRTFEALGYKVTRLHRTSFGDYRLGNLTIGNIH